MSSGSPTRPSGVLVSSWFIISGWPATYSRALVMIEPTKMPLTRIRGARSLAASRVQCASAALAVPYARNPRSAVRPIIELMLTIDFCASPLVDPVAVLEHQRHRGDAQRVRGRDVEAERLLEEADVGLEELVGERAADVVDDRVDAAELVVRRLREPGDRVEVAEVGGYDEGPAPGGPDLLRDPVELLLGPRRDDHVGAGLGQRDRRSRLRGRGPRR